MREMARLTVGGLLSLAFPLIVVRSQEVNTTSGLVRGTVVDSIGVKKYLGIPYAEAPVGDLRFKPPVRKARMEGVFNATNNDFTCPQHMIIHLTSSNVTEDCLRLDIYVPIKVSENEKIPVMVWIHGGGYQFGNSKSYDGSILAAQNNVIVVAMNYRLGILGFLNTNDKNAVGNFGLRDQCSAIEWVVDNIESFGGNSSSVTLFGESAGSASVLQQAMSTLCEGKFQRVIAQSGTHLSKWAYSKDPSSAAQKLASSANCPSEPVALVDCLRGKSWEELIAQQPLSYGELSVWVPTYSSDVFPENPLTLTSSSETLKRFRSMDLMIGVTMEEGELEFNTVLSNGSFFVRINETQGILTDEEHKRWLREIISMYFTNDLHEIDRLFPAFQYQYTDWKHKNDIYANTRMVIKLLSDVSFNVGTLHTARLHAGNMKNNNDTFTRGNTYFYQLQRKGSWAISYPWTEGATHVDDISFMFGFALYQNATQGEKDLSNGMMEYWGNFAKSGSTNEPSQKFIKTTWPKFDVQTEEYIELDVDMSAESTGNYPYGRRVAFWDKFVTPQLKLIRQDEEDRKQPPKCENKGPSSIAVSTTLSDSSLFCVSFYVLSRYFYFS